MKTRIIVAGCRDFHGYQFIEETLDAYIKPLEGKVEILSGSAPGVDQLGEHYAIAHNLPLLRFPADWDTHGKSAGPIRNRKMAKYASQADRGVLFAFWDGKSRGTQSMVYLAQQEMLEVHVIAIPKNKPMTDPIPSKP